MAHNCKKDKAEPEAQNKDSKAKEEKIKTVKTKSRKRTAIIFDAFGGLCLTAGGISFFVNHLWAEVSAVLLCIGFVSVAAGVRLTLINHESTRRLSNAFFSITTIVSVAFCGLLFLQELSDNPKPFPKPKPKPHFIFFLHTPDMQSGDATWITNDFLAVTNFGVPVDVNGFLMIPIRPGESNLDLLFSVKNNSDVELRNLQISLSLPLEWRCVTDTNKWHNAENFMLSKTGEQQTWWLPFPFVV